MVKWEASALCPHPRVPQGKLYSYNLTASVCFLRFITAQIQANGYQVCLNQVHNSLNSFTVVWRPFGPWFTSESCTLPILIGHPQFQDYLIWQDSVYVFALALICKQTLRQSRTLQFAWSHVEYDLFLQAFCAGGDVKKAVMLIRDGRPEEAKR